MLLQAQTINVLSLYARNETLYNTIYNSYGLTSTSWLVAPCTHRPNSLLLNNSSRLPTVLPIVSSLGARFYNAKQATHTKAQQNILAAVKAYFNHKLQLEYIKLHRNVFLIQNLTYNSTTLLSNANSLHSMTWDTIFIK